MEFGSVSSVAYTPDSFGHPAQFPQIFAGFGLDAFVYWRGNGSEIDALGPTYAWEAPDGSTIPACLLAKGYFCASALPSDVEEAVERLTILGEQLASGDGDAVLFMNGVDHALPDANTREVCEALAAATGWSACRGLLEDYVAVAVDGRDLARFAGELVGARLAILLPGVWSSRMALKLRNRRAETALLGWAEPWTALGRRYGTSDERPALRLAWRALLANQAHDSICGSRCTAALTRRRVWPSQPPLGCSSGSPASAPSGAHRGRTGSTSRSSTRPRTPAPTSCASRLTAFRHCASPGTFKTSTR
jgi:hypothetical protein